MNQKVPSQNSRLNNLDKNAEEIGMGGNLIPEISEEKYRKRMEKRKEVQTQRLKERQKEKGLIIINTGQGKGKTTAALGMGIRTLGHNHKVAIIQFIKGGWEPGESLAFKKFGGNLKFHAYGEGFTWETQDRNKDIRLVQSSWIKAFSYIKDSSYKLVILDEIIIAIKLGYIDEEEIIEGIKMRPELTHVVLTGRGASKKLIDSADLVTEMKLIHHPFREQGVKAQEGIEY
ncbi:cob(I)yrinic acid a,c-diamide adenosyltransferase [Prochlorococcus marinus]|uniref:Cob(I)yrinic acid a,c-diamide adenosyltransferase n=1 Tax=Prochlorococcus marinus XMU1408 TaxID=2213228 RepID=A0A318R491_PROMR|nr:cob(I)yrinic acid a,c-diamide adenosyltransferase [Prochlorococcus marinus]MBW3041550.1 cob(I)yrinic acid a,c-diamide adenosyltransferase [Prochlorococcus marinus str. XMU1408]PYE02708.1 cob(I)yrinic acid a,c-diamide adenosyltransferase [Prochlorococcus marinus XMU1408]